MGFYDELIHSVLEKSNEEFTDCEAEGQVAKVLNIISEELSNSFEDDYMQLVDDERVNDEAFNSRLIEIWSEPINRLKAFKIISLQAGDIFFNNIIDENIEITNNEKLALLKRFHGRAIKVVEEIIILMTHGYADGAAARWRTLYEISALANFISDNENLLSIRYIDYFHVEAYKEMNIYLKNYEKLGYSQMTLSEIERRTSEYKSLINKYGSSFGRNYGWASGYVKDLTFDGIAKKVNLDHIKPHYKLACNKIHSGISGSIKPLGLVDDEDIILAGASLYGLSEAGQGAAVSLSIITCVLLNFIPSTDNYLQMKLIKDFSRKVCSSFHEIQKELKKELLERK